MKRNESRMRRALRGRRAGDRWRRRDELGASALEWAIIAAIAVLMVSVVGGVVFQVVRDKTKSISDCANQPVGTACPGTP